MERRDFVKKMTAWGTGLLFRSPLVLPAQQIQPNPEIKRVLVMFKCHFDAGFIDTQANVIHKYFSQYFPQAIEIARAENSLGKRRYVWTTGSWLLFEYLEQASPHERNRMEEAIARGDIAWHALPFNWQTELISQSMIEGSLALSQSLDRRFGVVTSGAKMTDVPGHTRAIITPLAKHGIDFLEIGGNSAYHPAQVPPIFLWKDPSGASLPVMYHLNYGGIAHVPGSDLALVTSVRKDNSGPHTAEEIAAIYADLAARFPTAEITACDLSEMARAVEPYRGNLPVVTQEIGDVWIYGCPSDPLKLARYRELSRLRDAWILQGAFRTGDKTDLALLRHVLLEVEHTWGTDTKTWIDFDNYLPTDLARMLDTKGYKVMEFSWQEKRQDLLDGIATLPTSLRDQAQRAIQSLNAVEPNLSTEAVAYSPEQLIETAHFILRIDAQTGAITRLQNRANGREWASHSNPIALLTYQTLSQKDYYRLFANYVFVNDKTRKWVFKDTGKPNIEKFGARSQDLHPQLDNVQVEETANAHRIVARLHFKGDEAFQSGLASFPRKVFVELFMPKAESRIDLTVSCFEKRATRLPEALWLTFNPIAEERNGWTFYKSDEPVSPFDVVVNGNRHMHGLSKGFVYSDHQSTFYVETVDAPVITLGERTPIGFSNIQPDLSTGVHSSLYNNCYGTNYVMWYGEDMRFRYILRT
jgi:hypothetical protein